MYAQLSSMAEAVAVMALAIAALAWSIAMLQSRKQIEQARARGLWPPLGEIPTDDDLKRLFKSGETILAIRMCRQIHNMGFVEAKAVVERLAKSSAGGEYQP